MRLAVVQRYPRSSVCLPGLGTSSHMAWGITLYPCVTRIHKIIVSKLASGASKSKTVERPKMLYLTYRLCNAEAHSDSNRSKRVLPAVPVPPNINDYNLNLQYPLCRVTGDM